jgi:hypothetical protein
MTTIVFTDVDEINLDFIINKYNKEKKLETNNILKWIYFLAIKYEFPIDENIITLCNVIIENIKEKTLKLCSISRDFDDNIQRLSKEINIYEYIFYILKFGSLRRVIRQVYYNDDLYNEFIQQN